MRHRHALFASLTAAAVTAGLLAVPVPAAAATPPAAGSFVTVAARRVLDTRTGAYGNRRGAIGAGRSISVRVAGRDGVPTGAAAVAVSLAVVHAARGGVLVAAAPSSRRPGVSSVSFGAGDSSGAGLAVVPVRNGRIMLWNVSSGPLQLTADVAGYYVGGRAVEGGAYHAVAPARVVDTRHGTDQNRRGALRAGANFSPRIAGHANIPDGASAVLATVTVIGARTSGSVNVLTYGGDAPPPSIQVSAGHQISQLEVVPLSLSGRITIGNHTRGAVQLSVDVSGYFAAGAAATAGMTQAIEASKVAVVSIGAHRSTRVVVAGRGGVPKSATRAVIATVRVLTARASGSIGSTRGGLPTVVQFSRGSTPSGTAVVSVLRGAAIALSNSSSRPVRIELDIDGYVPGTGVPAATPSTARYLDDLTDDTSADAATMAADGAQDGSSGARFVLLDVGAQTITAPLSASSPGVALARTSTRVTRTYAQLVEDITAYLVALRGASGTTAITVAVGTNNDGAWVRGKPDYYAPAARGTDWAQDVIDPLRSNEPSGVTVVGADDIEAAFASTESQAAAWEDAYFAASPAELVFNGDANGCPQTPGVVRRACAYGWTQADYHHLAWHGGRVVVLPQIFYPYEAAKWANIDASASGALNFLGSLTEQREYSSQLAPAPARALLFRALTSVQASVNLPYDADI